MVTLKMLLKFVTIREDVVDVIKDLRWNYFEGHVLEALCMPSQ